MNQIIRFGLLLLLFAPAPFLESFPVTSRYDRASDTTTARIELLNDDSAQVNLTIQGSAVFRGNEPNEDGQFYFVVTATRGHITRKTPPLFTAQESLRLTLGATPLDAPLTDYNKEFYEMIQRGSETARAEIKRADLPKLLATKQLTGQCGAIQFKLSEAAVAALKDFVTHQVAVK